MATAHLPLITTPPSTGVAIAVGLNVPHTRASGVANTSSCTESGNWQTIHVGIRYTEAVQASDPSTLPSSPATSTNVRVSASKPP